MMIITGVVHQLNRIYTLFKENNPSFSGPVSIFAHSLGSVITYDILLHWSPLLLYDKYVTEAINAHLQICTDESSADTMKAYQSAREMLHEKIDGGIRKMLQTKDEQLKFNVLFLKCYPLFPYFLDEKVKYLFAVGSPLSVFLVMRGATYHDLLPGKANTDARSGGDDDLDEEDECDSTEDFDARSGCSSPRSLTPPLGDNTEKPVKKGWFSFTSSSKKNTVNHEPPVEIAKEAEPEIPLADRILGNAIRTPHRIDFQLQPGLTEKSYWSVLKSHFCYWTNADLALFIANTLYTKPNFKHLEVA
uniref:DDHD domain-containing protein n=1 Tax=Heterorhabditis bacteriophora TaxID=37862 RepID=A0A1I7W7C5_HETBA